MEKRKFHIFEVKIKACNEVIDQVGLIQRSLDADLFSSVVHHIIVDNRFRQRHRQQSGEADEAPDAGYEVNAETILSADIYLAAVFWDDVP